MGRDATRSECDQDGQLPLGLIPAAIPHLRKRPPDASTGWTDPPLARLLEQEFAFHQLGEQPALELLPRLPGKLHAPAHLEVVQKLIGREVLVVHLPENLWNLLLNLLIT